MYTAFCHLCKRGIKYILAFTYICEKKLEGHRGNTVAAHVVEGLLDTGQMGDTVGGRFFILSLFILFKF